MIIFLTFHCKNRTPLSLSNHMGSDCNRGITWCGGADFESAMSFAFHSVDIAIKFPFGTFPSPRYFAFLFCFDLASGAGSAPHHPTTKNRSNRPVLVRVTGLEPARGCHQILSLARLPVPPHPHIDKMHFANKCKMHLGYGYFITKQPYCQVLRFKLPENRPI